MRASYFRFTPLTPEGGSTLLPPWRRRATDPGVRVAGTPAPSAASWLGSRAQPASAGPPSARGSRRARPGLIFATSSNVTGKLRKKLSTGAFVPFSSQTQPVSSSRQRQMHTGLRAASRTGATFESHWLEPGQLIPHTTTNPDGGEIEHIEGSRGAAPPPSEADTPPPECEEAFHQ
jgi:hypothetical protein